MSERKKQFDLTTNGATGVGGDVAMSQCGVDRAPAIFMSIII